MSEHEFRTIYRNLSPLDHRYYLANTELFEQLSDYMSEEALIRHCLVVEGALLKGHLEARGAITEEQEKRIDEAVAAVSPREVYEEERTTRHAVRALVNVLRRKLPEELLPYVHLGATSVDILDTAAALRLRGATERVVLPLLISLEEELVELSEAEAETPQVGRTHGRHAVPITLGFAYAEYVARLGKSIERIAEGAGQLRGKMSGAVGGYNAMSLITADPVALERAVLERLELEPSEYSNQIVEPEYELRLLLEINTAFGVLANLADDLRNLQRSEIDELREFFHSSQVGSSTMPQKRNPWNSEHVKSLWKAFAPRVTSFFMDQISEHQRDLTNSASGRFVADYLSGFIAAANRMLRIVRTLRPDRQRLEENLSSSGDLLLSEAAYVLLARGGHTDAHEAVRRLTLRCEERGIGIGAALDEEPELRDMVDRQLRETLGMGAQEFFSHPGSYRGKTAERAREIAARYRQRMRELRGGAEPRSGNAGTAGDERRRREEG
jgi:adenylosuccinate lyase